MEAYHFFFIYFFSYNFFPPPQTPDIALLGATPGAPQAWAAALASPSPLRVRVCPEGACLQVRATFGAPSVFVHTPTHITLHVRNQHSEPLHVSHLAVSICHVSETDTAEAVGKDTKTEASPQTTLCTMEEEGEVLELPPGGVRSFQLRLTPPASVPSVSRLEISEVTCALRHPSSPPRITLAWEGTGEDNASGLTRCIR